MPMDFPDMESLKRAAEIHDFRQPNDGETEIAFRLALASHVRPRDFIESEEIRSGKGWDKFTDEDNAGMIGRSFLCKR